MSTAVYDRASFSTYDIADKDQLKNVTAQVESLAITESTDASAQTRPAAANDHWHSRQSPDLAAGIGNSLVLEVRKLRSKINELEAARASEQQGRDYAMIQWQQLEKQQDQLKDKNWELELSKQELEEQLDTASKKLNRMAAEYARLEKELYELVDVKAEQAKIEAEANSAARQHEQHRLQLVKELRALKKENAHLIDQLQTSATEVSLWKAKHALATHSTKPDVAKPPSAQALTAPPDPVDDKSSSMTPPGSPKISAHMEAESLKHFLAHAHRTINNLRSALHKEKLERIEIKKLLAESQETIEDLRRETLSNHSHRKKQARRSSRHRRRARAKRSSYYSASEDEDTAAVTDQCHATDGFPSADHEPTIALPQNSLFDELQKSTTTVGSTVGSDKETQTHPAQQIDKDTQTELVTLDTAVQCHSDIASDFVSEGTQTTASRQSYLEPFKRVIHDTSMTLRSKKQQPDSPLGMSQSLTRGTDIANPTPTVTTPPTVSTIKFQQPPSHARSSSIGSAPSVDRRSKLLECASKRNSIRSPQTLSPSKPTVSTSTATSTRHGKDPIIPAASRSDTVAVRSPSRYSPRGSPTLDTLSETLHEPDAIEPSVIDAVTQTMIGNWMWKYTRRYSMGKVGISQQKGHMRYFWIHPYTRTLYWSTKPPGVDHDETKSKRAFIKDIWSVPCGENQCESVPFNLLIRTSARDLMIHAESMHQHHQWIAATCYLLGRPEQIEAEGRFLSSVSTNTFTSGNTFCTHNPAFLNSSILQGSIISQSDDDSDDFINIRQCCNGKHDVSTLAQR